MTWIVILSTSKGKLLNAIVRVIIGYSCHLSSITILPPRQQKVLHVSDISNDSTDVMSQINMIQLFTDFLGFHLKNLDKWLNTIILLYHVSPITWYIRYA